MSVRLACVRHAASVRPEPGSNSLNYGIISTVSRTHNHSRALSALFDTLAYHSLIRLRITVAKAYFCKKISRVSFSRCLIFKVRRAACEAGNRAGPQKRALLYYQTGPALSTTFFGIFAY